MKPQSNRGSEAEDTDRHHAQNAQSANEAYDVTDPRWSTVRPTHDRFEQPFEAVPAPPPLPSDIHELSYLRSEDRLQIQLPPELVRDLRSVEQGPLDDAARANLVDRMEAVLVEHQRASMRPPTQPIPKTKMSIGATLTISAAIAVALLVFAFLLASK